MVTKIGADPAGLRRVPDNGKAELIDGKVVLMSPTGGLPGYAGGEIFASLRDFSRRTRTGLAFPDNVGFVVNLPNRQSFSPDAAFFTGPNPGMKFPVGVPVFCRRSAQRRRLRPAGRA